jgi:hypothetical protein
MLLAFLSALMIMVGVSAFVFCRVMQPTVLGGGRSESALYRTVPASALTPGGNSDEAEQMAIKTAETENRDLQSQDLQVSRAVEKVATVQAKRRHNYQTCCSCAQAQYEADLRSSAIVGEGLA